MEEKELKVTFCVFMTSGITALDERNIEMSDSEEEEYNTNGIVYDSDETDEDSDDGDGSNLSDDRRKVLVMPRE